MNCVQIVRKVYEDINIKIPDRIGALTVDNYLEAFYEDRKFVTSQLIKVVTSLGDPISIEKCFVWDLLICEQSAKEIFFPGIHVGNGVLCSMEETGVCVVPFSKHCKIFLGRRFKECHQHSE